jgi:hypothetical protein
MTKTAQVLRLDDTPDPEALFISGDDLVKGKIAIDYLISSLIPKDTVGLLFGPSGEGKTFVALDWALNIASGKDIAGHSTRKGLVIYLAGEGRCGLEQRVRAWEIQNGSNSEDLSRFILSLHKLDNSGLETLLTAGKKRSERQGVPVELIVVDTLARYMEGDENSTKDMNSFVKVADALRKCFAGCVVLIVHHSGHNEGGTPRRARGSSVLHAAVDFEMLCEKGKLIFSKMKDGALPDTIIFGLQQIIVGEGENREFITSCVVEYGKRSPQHAAADLTQIDCLAIKALSETSARMYGEDAKRKAALEKDWRKTFTSLRLQEDPMVENEALRKSFDRSRNKLLEQGIVKKDYNFTVLIQDLTFPSPK